MGKKARFDEPGAWHHVLNRGIARRTIIENRQDVRYFLTQLALAVKAGWFEVHAYSILSNHFHLLLRSVDGHMWRGMQQFQSRYVRWFNRTRDRTGHLLGSRYFSKRICSEVYWRTVVRYIDQNALSEAIPHRETVYPYCSRYFYLRKSGPSWLTRNVLESVVCDDSNTNSYDPSDYDVVFGLPIKTVEKNLSEHWIDSDFSEQEILDDLFTASPPEIRSWMIGRARIADGTEPGLPVADVQTILRLIRERAAGKPIKSVLYNGMKRDVWSLLAAGLLRSVCGQTHQELAQVCHCSASTLYSRCRIHSTLLQTNSEYAQLASEILAETFRSDWGKIRFQKSINPIPGFE